MKKNKIFKQNVEKALEDLANPSFSRTISTAEGNKIWYFSFAELVLAVFDDTALSNIIEEGETVFSKEADAALKDLDESTNAIDELTQTDEEIFNSPEMEVVRQKAARALELVRASDGSESTVEIVEYPNPN